MKRMLSFRPALILLLVLPLIGADQAPPASQPDNDYCQLFGTVFIEETPAFADYQVFVEDIETFADLVVYREETEGFADRPGFWYFTDVKAFADFTIGIEQTQAMADFTIAYTDFRSAAGCP